MSLYDEAMLNEIAEGQEAAEGFTAPPDPEEAAGGYRFEMPDLSFLAAPTGEGSIDNYIEHPLNFDGRKSTARILRGCTGLFGSLDYALVDITLGVIEKIKEKDKNVNRSQE